jgi:MFS transporter, DHA1 family, inner membrane transport protein
MDADLPAAVAPIQEATALSADTDSVQTAPAQRRVQLVLCLAVFFAALNFFAPTPFYPQMAHDLQTTVPLLGQVMTLMALLSAGLGLAIGPLADRYGYRWPLVVGLLAVAGTLLGTGLTPAYPVLLGLGVLGGLGDALVYSLPFALAATYFAGDAQRRAIGWTLAALSMAPIIGVPLLTTLGGFTSWRLALVVTGLAAAGVAWFVTVSLPADGRRPTTPLRAQAISIAYAPLLQHPPSLRLIAVSALRGMWWGGLLTYLGAFLGTAVGLRAHHVGLVYALAGGAYAVGSVAAGGRFGAVSPRTVLAASSVAGVLVGPLLVLPSIRVVLPLLLIVCLASAVSGVSVAALLAAQSPAGAGTTMVFNGSILNFGAGGGAALGGLLITLVGYHALGIGLPLFALVAAVLAWWPARV